MVYFLIVHAKIQTFSYIYAYCDLKFQYLSSPNLDIPKVYYMVFQMGPLKIIFQFSAIFTIILNKGQFRPFYPNLVNLGNRLQTTLGIIVEQISYLELYQNKILMVDILQILFQCSDKKEQRNKTLNLAHICGIRDQVTPRKSLII